jgi:carboxyl-terminal processing protease
MILAFVAVAMLAFAGGMVTDRLMIGDGSSSANNGSNIGATNSAELKNFGLYNEALNIIRQKFVGRSTLTDQQLLYGSIKGLVDSLGDTGHTTFLTPDEYKQFQSQLSATFAGIGVEMADQTPPYTIGRVLPGTPAEKAGLKAGDTITAVDGVNAASLSYSDFVGKIRGTAGTTVTLSILHSGSITPVDIKVTRATLNIPLVEWGMVPGTHVADIVLAEFSQGAYDQLAAAVTSATSAGATSIVFDMRGNPGGYASEAQKVASEFLTNGVIYIQRDASGNQNPIDVAAGETATKLPMVVLVDHDSASAAEIVAGALQDNGRAKIVGLTTFGTGTVLTPETLSDGSVILLGTSDWLTPHGHRIFGVGITPDQQVAMPSGSQPTDPTTLSTMTATTFASSTDAELVAAVKDLAK